MTDTHTGPSAAPTAVPSVDLTADPRPRLLAAADQAVALVRALSPADLDRPTPCTEFDVRTVAAHVIGVLRRITGVLDGREALSIPSIAEVEDGALAAEAADGRDALAAAWADDEVLDRELRLPFGVMPGRAAALAYAQEFTVHAWDLAVATGRAADLDGALAEAALPVARRFVPAAERGGRVPFGPVVEVAGTSGPYEQLAGWLGRDPAWGRA